MGICNITKDSFSDGGLNYQKKDDIIITPVRSGLGLRAGINLGYTKYKKT